MNEVQLVLMVYWKDRAIITLLFISAQNASVPWVTLQNVREVSLLFDSRTVHYNNRCSLEGQVV